MAADTAMSLGATVIEYGPLFVNSNCATSVRGR
jgi:hypothetical protein